MALSTYLASQLGAWSDDTRTVFPAPPVNVFLALFLGNPNGDLSGAAELSGGNYRRTSFEFESVVNGVNSILLQNKDVIIFPVSTANLGTVSHYGVFDAETGGEMLYFGEFNAPASWLETTTFTVPVNQLQIDLITRVVTVTS